MPVDVDVGVELIIEEPFLNSISMPISKPLTKYAAEKIANRSCRYGALLRWGIMYQAELGTRVALSHIIL